MGSFYTNITLRTTDSPGVVDALRTGKRTALVSQPQNGCVVVYDKETEDQDVEVLNRLASSLSTKLSCPALAVLVHDDDVLIYTLHENGELVDEYNSAPEYFASGEFGPSEGGDAERLARAFGGGDVAKAEAVLRAERAGDRDEGYVFESERHYALTEALGIPMLAVSTGFNYIEAGELPEGAIESSFIRIG